MATLFLMSKAQKRQIRGWLDAFFSEQIEIVESALWLAIAMMLDDIGAEIIQDINSSGHDDMIEFLRIFGYSIYDHKIIKLDQ